MILIIDCGTSWLEEIKQNVTKQGHQYKVIKIDNLNNCNLSSFSGIIISGAPTLLTQLNLKEFLKPFAFIKTITVPVLGICLGHQIIGLLHGSKIDRSKMVNKKESIKITKNNGLFSDIKNNSLFREEHSEYITLPKQFHLIADSDSCNNEAMKHKKINVYGTQFHPEVSGRNGKLLIRNFLQLCAK